MVTIQPVEAPDGTFEVRLSMDGQPMTPHRGFPTKDEAEAMVIRMAAVCRALNQPMKVVHHG